MFIAALCNTKSFWFLNLDTKKYQQIMIENETGFEQTTKR